MYRSHPVLGEIPKPVDLLAVAERNATQVLGDFMIEQGIDPLSLGSKEDAMDALLSLTKGTTSEGDVDLRNCTKVPLDLQYAPLEEKAPTTDPNVPESPKSPERALDVQVGGGHYKDLAIQPIEYTMGNKLDFIQGNIIKYATRHKDKNGIEDLKKVIHYAELAMQLQYDKEGNYVK